MNRPTKEERQKVAKEETKEQLLLRRVFKEIAYHYFKDHKLSPWYVGNVRFTKSLGGDIANYVQGKNPEYFHKLRKEMENLKT